MARYETLTLAELTAIKAGICPDCQKPGEWKAESTQDDAADWRCGHCGTLFHLTRTAYAERVVIDPAAWIGHAAIQGVDKGSFSARLPMCTHAGVVSQGECPYCNAATITEGQETFRGLIITTKGSARRFGKGRD